MNNDDDVTLTIGGTVVSGWKAVRITRGIERIPSDFDISLTERYPNLGDVSVSPGDACVLKIGADTVVTGYVDRVTRTVDPHQHPITVSGRGMCEDLVDCSAQLQTFQFQNQTTAAIAGALAGPFGIDVLALSVGIVHPQVCLNVGESPFSVIDRLCKLANCWRSRAPPAAARARSSTCAA